MSVDLVLYKDRTGPSIISPRLGHVNAWAKMLLDLLYRAVAKATCSNSLYYVSNLIYEYIGLSIDRYSGGLL
jgi:hypothetical protein